MAFSIDASTGDGIQTNFTVTFPYLSQDHVFCFVDGVETAYVWIDPSTVQISPAPALGTTVVRQRITPADKLLASFDNGTALTNSTTTVAQTQQLYLAQENQDLQAFSLRRGLDLLWDAQGARIKNVGDPVLDQDAATKLWTMSSMDSQVAQAADAAARAEAAAETGPFLIAYGAYHTNASIIEILSEDPAATLSNAIWSLQLSAIVMSDLDSDLFLQFGVGQPPVYIGSGYAWRGDVHPIEDLAGEPTVVSANNDAALRLFASQLSGGPDRQNSWIKLDFGGPGQLSNTHFSWDANLTRTSDSKPVRVLGSGVWNQTDQITGIRIYPSEGTISAYVNLIRWAGDA